MTTPNIRGHETEAKARKAAMKWFTFTDGTKPVEGVHFHIKQNHFGLWTFREGPAPKAA
jgi:hypothetical protein